MRQVRENIPGTMVIHLQHTAIADRAVVCPLGLRVATTLTNAIVRAVLGLLIFLQSFHRWGALRVSSCQSVIWRSRLGCHRHEVVKVDVEHEKDA
jgi:hypothetical protein